LLFITRNKAFLEFPVILNQKNSHGESPGSSDSLQVEGIEFLLAEIRRKNFPAKGKSRTMRNEAFKVLRTWLGVAAVALVCAALPAFAAPPADGYSITKKIQIPDQGSWDYLTVDEAARRLYVSHGTQVEVIDVDSLTVVATIPNTAGVHGIAIAPELGRLFTSNGQTATVTIFDLKTLKPIADVPTGKKPDAIIFDPATSRVFAFNGASDSATAIDGATGKVAGTIALGGGPEYAAADANGFVYDNLEEESLVLKIDSHKLTVDQRWPTAPCASPSSMAIDRANHRLFLGCRNKLMAVMNADTGKVITTLPIGDHVDATVYDSDTKLIFNSNGEGTISVIRQDDPDKYSAVETVKTLPKAKTMALDQKTHRLFLSTAEAGQFEVLVVGK
jgi:DNA-binding beta-propeller fold protein YncE